MSHEATAQGIARMKASEARNSAEMLDYLDRMAWERQPHYVKKSPELQKLFKVKLYNPELAEMAYQQASAIMGEKWKAEGCDV